MVSRRAALAAAAFAAFALAVPAHAADPAALRPQLLALPRQGGRALAGLREAGRPQLQGRRLAEGGTDAQIEQTIHEGKKGTMMASFDKQLSPEEIKGLVGYIRKLGARQEVGPRRCAGRRRSSSRRSSPSARGPSRATRSCGPLAVEPRLRRGLRPRDGQLLAGAAATSPTSATTRTSSRTTRRSSSASSPPGRRRSGRRSPSPARSPSSSPSRSSPSSSDPPAYPRAHAARGGDGAPLPMPWFVDHLGRPRPRRHPRDRSLARRARGVAATRAGARAPAPPFPSPGSPSSRSRTRSSRRGGPARPPLARDRRFPRALAAYALPLAGLFAALVAATGGAAWRHLVPYTAAAEYEPGRMAESYLQFAVVAAPLLLTIAAALATVPSAFLRARHGRVLLRYFGAQPRRAVDDRQGRRGAELLPRALGGDDPARRAARCACSARGGRRCASGASRIAPRRRGRRALRLPVARPAASGAAPRRRTPRSS